MHTSERKCKIADERRVFNEEWTSKYFFTDTENKAVRLLCQETLVVLKEFNLKRHHETKHKKFGCNLSEEERKLKAVKCVKQLKKQQALFTKQSVLQSSVIEEENFIYRYLPKFKHQQKKNTKTRLTMTRSK